MSNKLAVIANSIGDSIFVNLQSDGQRQVASIRVDGVEYHLERMRAKELLSKYSVDADPDYSPQTDRQGYCFVLVPFSKKSRYVKCESKIRP